VVFVTTSIVFGGLLAGGDVVFTAAGETLWLCLNGPFVTAGNVDAV
jgi:hypothetical protein